MGVLAVHACFAGTFRAAGRNEVSSKRWGSTCARMNWMRRIIVGTSIAPGDMPQAPGVAVPSVLKMPMCPHAAPFIADVRSRHRVPQFRVPGHRHATVVGAHENAMHAGILLRTGIKLATTVKISAASALAQPHSVGHDVAGLRMGCPGVASSCQRQPLVRRRRHLPP